MGPHPVESSLPTSSTQAAIAADDAEIPGAHQVGFLFGVEEGVLADDVAEVAVAAIQARYPLLRSRFRREGARLVRTSGELATPTVVEGDTDAIVRASILRPIDPAREAPFRVGIVRSPGGTRVHAVLHHHVYDAISAVVFVRDLLALLGGAPLDPAGEDHAAFVAVEAQRTRDLDATRAALARRLDGRSLTLPLPVQGLARTQLAARRVWTADDRGPTETFARLFSAWWLVLGDWLGRDDLVLGTTASLRPRAVRSVFGPAFQYVPLAPRISRTSSLADAMPLASAELRAAMGAAWLPIQQAYALAPPPGPHPWLGLNANFNFYDMEERIPGFLRSLRAGAPTRVGNLVLRELPLPDADVPRPYDLNLGITRAGGRFGAQLRYRPDLMDGATANRLLTELGRRAELA